MSALVASSGSVMEAGVVRRFLALVNCSITASISWRTQEIRSEVPTRRRHTHPLQTH